MDNPILAEALAENVAVSSLFDDKAVHAAILTETLKLADSLLHQAAKDIEATLFERVLDRLRAQLPELLDRILREHIAAHDTAQGATQSPTQDTPDAHG
jgi:Zn-dependent M32 family carboxypeptidase